MTGKERRERIESWVSGNRLARLLTSHVCMAFFYGIFLFGYEIGLLRQVIAPLHLLLIGWAGVLFMYDLLIRRIWTRLPYWKLLALFLISACMTVLSTLEGGWIAGVKSLVMIALPLVAFYPVCILENEAQRRNALIKAMMGAALIIFLASLAALGMYLVRYSEVLTFMGVERVTGYRYYSAQDPTSGMLLYGFYEDTNHAAAYALVFSVYSIFLYCACKQGLFSRRWMNGVGRIFAVINLVVQLTYFPLANSRGGWACLLVAAMATVFLYCFCSRLSEKRKWLRALKAFAIGVVCVVLLSAGLLALRSGMSQISLALREVSTQTVKPSEPVSTGDEKTETNYSHPEQDRTEVDSFDKKDANTGSGRLWIWKDVLSLYAKRPILGVGSDYKFYAVKYEVAPNTIGSGREPHNSYLDVLLAYGAVGFLILMAFWCLCLWRVLRRMVTCGKQLDGLYYFAFFAVLLIAGISFFLSCVFVNTTAMYYLLMIMTGYLIAPIGQEASGQKKIKEA